MRYQALLFLLLATATHAQTLQQKIDHSVLRQYDETTKPEMDVVSVERGYLMSKTGLKEYVQVQDEKFNAAVRGQSFQKKSAFGSLKDIYDSFMSLKPKANDSVSSEKIEKQKALVQSSVRVGATLKSILARAGTSSPFKTISTNVCATTGARIDVFYKQEKFSISQAEVKSDGSLAHTTKLQFKDRAVQESENYVQTGSYYLSEYETNTYSTLQNNKWASLVRSKSDINQQRLTNENMIDQLIVQIPVGTAATTIQKADLPTLKHELQESWLLLKRAGACCNEFNCRRAMISNYRTNPGSTSSESSGLSPYVR